jgi:hypothetical protein
MRKFFLLLSFLTSQLVAIRAQQPAFADTAYFYFEELKKITGAQQALWGKDLYAPILLVHPQSREVFANEADSAGILQPAGKIFRGQLPASVNISNTSLEWSGRRWAMLMLPLPLSRAARIHLFCHELFHRAQPALGFEAYNPDNNHLNQRDGRIYLRLELEALKKAIVAHNKQERQPHLRAALVFRHLRHQKFSGADSTENRLELNEGICEFTGLLMSGRDRSQTRAYLLARIDRFMASPSYVRSFAYETTPVYGWLLQEHQPGWNRQINAQTKLHDFFQKAFGIAMKPEQLEREAWQLSAIYNGEAISKEEAVREEARLRLLAAYRQQFVDSAHLTLPLIKMNMSFDYTRMVPLEPYGTVYPSIRISDEWGILEASEGALISNNWDQVTLSLPLENRGSKISGKGWTLELRQGYSRAKDAASNNYKLILKK